MCVFAVGCFEFGRLSVTMQSVDKYYAYSISATPTELEYLFQSDLVNCKHCFRWCNNERLRARSLYDFRIPILSSYEQK